MERANNEMGAVFTAPLGSLLWFSSCQYIFRGFIGVVVGVVVVGECVPVAAMGVGDGWDDGCCLLTQSGVCKKT